MTSPRSIPAFPWPLALGVAFLLVGLAWGASCVVGSFVADAEAQAKWSLALKAGAIVNLLGAIAGLLPAWILHRRRIEGGAAYGFAGGMLVRIGLVVALFVFARPERLSNTLAWPAAVMGLYLLFLFAEVAVMGRWLSRLPAPSAATAPAAAGLSPETP